MAKNLKAHSEQRLGHPGLHRNSRKFISYLPLLSSRLFITDTLMASCGLMSQIQSTFSNSNNTRSNIIFTYGPSTHCRSNMY